jgi:hypothetical protein
MDPPAIGPDTETNTQWRGRSAIVSALSIARPPSTGSTSADIRDHVQIGAAKRSRLVSGVCPPVLREINHDVCVHTRYSMSMIGELRHVPAGLLPALEDRATRKQTAEAVMESEGLSLDKAWNGLGYLLGGLCEEDPLGGKPVRGVDTGYGPPGLLSPDEVQTCARELAAIDEEALRSAYNPKGMMAEDVYPTVWDREDERDSNLAWLLETFRNVREFYQEAARQGNAVMYFLS